METKEIEALCNACAPYLKPIILTAVNTGIRKGKLLNLKWSDLDFHNRLIYLSDTKGAKKREIPMNEIMYKTLLRIRKNPDSPYVFCHKNGKPYKDLRASLDKAARKAGIERFRFHDLRHTFASHLVMAGVDLKTVQELLGHKTIEMTLRYAHLSPGHKRAAVEVLCNRMDTI
ncbi:MAG: site-specific integrase [Candidatus Aerophobetes bacterium]|nr:site-specific integrase [Candidatus Aerophobetes bacterium]